MIKSIETIKETNSLLQEYIGAKIQLWMYSPSLRRVVLRTTIKDNVEEIYIIGAGCQYISGSVSWENAGIKISAEKPDLTLVCMATKIEDKKGGFLLIAKAGFAIVVGTASEFENAIHNFQ